MKFVLSILVLASALSACSSSQILELGNGRYMAVYEQKGGIPTQASMISGARDVAAERCGGLNRLVVISVGADTAGNNMGNHGQCSMTFECTQQNTQQTRALASGGERR